MGKTLRTGRKSECMETKLQEILKNHRKHKRIRIVEGRHRGVKKHYEGKERMICKVNDR